MSDSINVIAQLLREDRRYKFDAYALVFESLTYAHDVLHLGTEAVGESGPPQKAAKTKGVGKTEPVEQERHLSGQQLCEAIRVYALEQYGMLAKRVLNSLGVRSTSDFGEIVYNLIRIGQMRKTKHDRREDFDNVYDFEAGFDRAFQITMAKR